MRDLNVVEMKSVAGGHASCVTAAAIHTMLVPCADKTTLFKKINESAANNLSTDLSTDGVHTLKEDDGSGGGGGGGGGDYGGGESGGDYGGGESGGDYGGGEIGGDYGDGGDGSGSGEAGDDGNGGNGGLGGGEGGSAGDNAWVYDQGTPPAGDQLVQDVAQNADITSTCNPLPGGGAQCVVGTANDFVITTTDSHGNIISQMSCVRDAGWTLEVAVQFITRIFGGGSVSGGVDQPGYTCAPVKK